MKRLALTTGDWDGIGSEVVAKALHQLGPRRNVQFVLFRSPKCPPAHIELIKQRFNIFKSTAGQTPQSWPTDSKTLIDCISRSAPESWVHESAKLCLRKVFAGMVTGPMSKRRSLGHTAILAQVTGQKNLRMAFFGSQFNVLLITGHLPLQKVARHLTRSVVLEALRQAHDLRACLPSAQRNRPLALVGLNPHAGEQGQIGTEDLKLRQLVKWVKQRGIRVEGPLVPDAAFLPKQWPLYSIYVCPYHDQGLIPFKLVHGFSEGVHLTVGLPFVRTSVDHGTAKELFGKDVADSGSIKQAIETAIALIRRQKP